ncbi:MAG: AsmA-like C-terminal region-containing protein, partial [Hyphomonadaceae bacterium]
LSTPVTLRIAVGLDRKRGVTKLDGEAKLGRGVLEMGGGRLDLSGGQLRGRYDLAADTLYVNELAIAGARTRISGQAKLTHASSLFGAPGAPAARFEIAAPRLELEMPGAFSGPLAIDNVLTTGAVRLADASVEIDAFEADVEKARLRVSGRFFWGDDGTGRLRPGLKLEGGVDGAMSPQTVVRYWPMQLAAASRQWCAEALTAGRLVNTRLRIDFTPKDLAAGALANDKLSLQFDFSGASVIYVDGMAPLTNAEGRAELQGNAFQAVVARGAIGDLALTDGKVALPRLSPAGAEATYSGLAAGPARSVVALLLQAPIGLGPRLPFEPSSIAGKGQARFAIKRPLGSGVPGDATKFSVDGRFENVGAVAKSGDFSIANWQLRVLGDDKALVLAGPLTVGGSTAELTWTEKVRAARDPSTVVLRGRMQADDLVSLGFPILKYADGPVAVEARSAGVGLDVNKADVRLDFADAALNLERGFWKKPPGAPAVVKFSARRQADDTLTLAGLDARGGGVSVTGDVRVTDAGELVEVNLPHVALPGALDGAVVATRDQAGVLQAKITGDLLDVGPFFAPEPPTAPSAGQMLNTTQHYSAPQGGLSPAYEVNADVARLRLRGGAELTQGRLVYTTDGEALTRLFVAGADAKGGPFDLSITPSPGQPVGKLAVHSKDAGFAVLALTGTDNVKGGEMTADGAWRFGRNPSAQINVKMKGFQVVRAPALAHLLSSVASLTGMVETLNGQGITFSDLDAPMTMADGRLHLDDFRAAGPSLGITAKGDVNLVNGAMNLGGVLVPSYGLNSMLGGVPILGDLLVSRKGEGVFGITYSLAGPAESPKVALNPFSALTPGILRRIFEPAPRRPALAEKAG